MADFTVIKSDAQLSAERLNFYTTREAAEYFGVTTSTIRKWIIDGCIKAEVVTLTGQKRIGKYLISSVELDRIDRESRKVEVLAATRKYWVRMLWRRELGKRM
jgi:excisionase family DNA binding protein